MMMYSLTVKLGKSTAIVPINNANALAEAISCLKSLQAIGIELEFSFSQNKIGN